MKQAVKLVFGLAVLGIALGMLDFRALADVAGRLAPGMLVAAVAASFFHYAVMGLRWHVLVRDAGASSAPGNLARYFYATMLNIFTPANIGGDVYRLFATPGGTGGRMRIVSVLLRERFVGLLAFLLVVAACAAAASLAGERTGTALPGTAAAAVLGAVLVCAAPMPLGWVERWRAVRRRRDLARLVSEGRRAFAFRGWREFGLLMGLSFLAILGWLVSLKIIAADIDLPISWFLLGVVATGVELVRLIPVSVQGIGVREGAYAWAFGVLAMSPEAGFVLGALGYLVLNLAMLLSGLIGWIGLPPRCEGGGTVGRMLKG